MFYFFLRKPHWQISSIYFSLHDLLIMFMAIMLSSAAAIQKKHFVLRTEHSVLFLLVCLCRNIQPWYKRCGWYPPSTDADDCSTSNTSTLCARYRWAHSTEPVESAAAGAASAHAQTGEVERSISFPPGTFIPVHWLLMNVFVLKSVFAECFSCPELIGEFFVRAWQFRFCTYNFFTEE